MERTDLEITKMKKGDENNGKSYVQNILTPLDDIIAEKCIYAKPYLSEGWFDELSDNLPYDFLNHVIEDNNSSLDIEQLSNWIDTCANNIDDTKFFPFKINFSLIDRSVLKLDEVLLGEYNAQESTHIQYRPYFLEFEGYCSNYNDFKKLMDYMESDDYLGYFRCQLGYDTEDRQQYTQDMLVVLTGDVMRSASPIELRGGQLVILKSTDLNEDKEFEAVLNESIYKIHTKTFVEGDEGTLKTEINNALFLPNISPEHMTVYNVGQGNYISIKLKNGKEILFDIGMTQSKIELGSCDIKDAIKEIYNLSPSLIVLSHWDLDHILGVSYSRDLIYNATWVVPDLWGLMKYKKKTKGGKARFTFVSDSAKRLLKYLDWSKKVNLLIIDESWNSSNIYKSDGGAIKIWSGIREYSSGKNGKNKCYNINPSNNFGLIMTLSHNHSVLLPGDCEYRKMPSDLTKDSYDYVVAPHHCSKMSEPFLKKNPKNKFVVLSYGIRNNHGHPDKCHMDELFNKGYEIRQTLGHKKISWKL